MGFLRKLPKTHPFWVFAELMFCKRRLTADKALYKGELGEQTIASFMGEPMSYLTLTALNVITEELSEYDYNILYRRVDPSTVLSSTDPLAICGDDFAAVRSELERILQFKRTAKSVGWVLSWKDGISMRILIFCEDHILVTTDQFGNINFRYIDVVKSRLMTTTSDQHGDNRSSVLGKGRMLRNQTDYIGDRSITTKYMCMWRKIFDRSYGYNLAKVQLPYFLPPMFGGLGVPIKEHTIPDWGWIYINYIYSILDNKDILQRYLQLSALQTLNTRLKKGISTRVLTLSALRSELKDYKFLEVKIPFLESKIDTKTILSDRHIAILVEELFHRKIPADPYNPESFDRDSLINEATQLGFIELSQSLEEIDRLCNFHTFFTSGVTREQRTFNGWCKDSSRYWRGILSKGLSKDRPRRFTSFQHLEREARQATSGFVLLDFRGGGLMNIGPSLKVDFDFNRRNYHVGNKKPYLKLSELISFRQEFLTLSGIEIDSTISEYSGIASSTELAVIPIVSQVSEETSTTKVVEGPIAGPSTVNVDEARERRRAKRAAQLAERAKNPLPGPVSRQGGRMVFSGPQPTPVKKHK
jgi:hypothetical protein